MSPIPLPLHAASRRRFAAAGLFVLAGCASTPPAPPAPLPSLASEQRWLAGWFKGTPVVVVGDDDDGIVVEVPQPYGFDPGQVMPRASLVAVLDKVADSLRRAGTLHVDVAAPGDPAAPALAAARTARVADHLYVRGVLRSRITPAAQAPADRVRLRLYGTDAPAP